MPYVAVGLPHYALYTAHTRSTRSAVAYRTFARSATRLVHWLVGSLVGYTFGYAFTARTRFVTPFITLIYVLRFPCVPRTLRAGCCTTHRTPHTTYPLPPFPDYCLTCVRSGLPILRLQDCLPQLHHTVVPATRVLLVVRPGYGLRTGCRTHLVAARVPDARLLPHRAHGYTRFAHTRYALCYVLTFLRLPFVYAAFAVYCTFCTHAHTPRFWLHSPTTAVRALPSTTPRTRVLLPAAGCRLPVTHTTPVTRTHTYVYAACRVHLHYHFAHACVLHLHIHPRTTGYVRYLAPIHRTPHTRTFAVGSFCCGLVTRSRGCGSHTTLPVCLVHHVLHGLRLVAVTWLLPFTVSLHTDADVTVRSCAWFPPHLRSYVTGSCTRSAARGSWFPSWLLDGLPAVLVVGFSAFTRLPHFTFTTLQLILHTPVGLPHYPFTRFVTPHAVYIHAFTTLRGCYAVTRLRFTLVTVWLHLRLLQFATAQFWFLHATVTLPVTAVGYFGSTRPTHLPYCTVLCVLHYGYAHYLCCHTPVHSVAVAAHWLLQRCSPLHTPRTRYRLRCTALRFVTRFGLLRYPFGLRSSSYTTHTVPFTHTGYRYTRTHSLLHFTAHGLLLHHGSPTATCLAVLVLRLHAVAVPVYGSAVRFLPWLPHALHTPTRGYRLRCTVTVAHALRLRAFWTARFALRFYTHLVVHYTARFTTVTHSSPTGCYAVHTRVAAVLPVAFTRLHAVRGLFTVAVPFAFGSRSSLRTQRRAARTFTFWIRATVAHTLPPPLPFAYTRGCLHVYTF